jgi:putative selenium metabolism protein SsnA
MSTILIKGGVIATLGAKNRVLHGHAILIENDRIAKIAPVAQFTGNYDRVINAKGKLVLPGFVNAHMHFYSTFARGLGKAAPSANFQEVLENLWWRLDKKLTIEDSYYSALIPLLDGIRHGTTTFIDHHASPFAVRGSLPAIAKAVKQSGLRASLCYELSDRDGDKIAQEGIEENAEFIKATQKAGDHQLHGMFGMHASFTIGDKTMEKAAKVGNDLGAGFHVHTAEAQSDQDYNVQHFGLRVVERFKKFGILGSKTILPHCVHITEAEMDLIKASDTMVVHNPQSNMNNAVGIMDLKKLTEKGILVGLGTDAMTVNMKEELRVAMWLHHLGYKNPSCCFMDVVNTLLFNNGKIAERLWPGLGLGTLTEGGMADIILTDYHTPTPLDEGTILGHMVFGVPAAPVDTTIASGRILMEGKKLLVDVCEAEVGAKALELSTALWARF